MQVPVVAGLILLVGSVASDAQTTLPTEFSTGWPAVACLYRSTAHSCHECTAQCPAHKQTFPNHHAAKSRLQGLLDHRYNFGGVQACRDTTEGPMCEAAAQLSHLSTLIATE